MISIIIPVYNVEDYIRKCIDSVRDQRYQDIEILLIDDGSEDQSGNICDEYSTRDDRIRVVHTGNYGLAAARNLGLSLAKGEYIGFVDSDDWIETDMYEVLIKRMNEEGVDICACGYGYEKAYSTKTVELRETVYDRIEAMHALLIEDINYHVWNKLYRREILEEITFPEGRNYEDIETMYKILYKCQKVAVSHLSKYHYRMRNDSITQTYNSRNLIDYAEAYINSYIFLNSINSLVNVTKEEILRVPAKGISRLWRWWYGCNENDKRSNDKRIDAIMRFTKTNIPLLGYRSWPFYLRVSTVFMHSRSKISFSLLYTLNWLYRKAWPSRGNVIEE